MPMLEGKGASSADIILDLMSIPTNEKWEFFFHTLASIFSFDLRFIYRLVQMGKYDSPENATKEAKCLVAS